MRLLTEADTCTRYVLPKLQAAVDAGCEEVIVPTENKRDVDLVPDDRDRAAVEILQSET